MRTPVLLATLFTATLLASCTVSGSTPAPAPVTPTPPGTGQQTGDVPPVALAGEWNYGYISPIEYYDPSSGKYMEASGTSAILKLKADGTFTDVGISVVTVGNCTTKLLVQSEGTVTYTDKTFTRVDKKVDSSVYNSCTGQVVKGGTLTQNTSSWTVEGEGDSAVLIITDAQGATGRWNRPHGTAPDGESQYTLSGTLTAPSGHKLYGTTVIACPKSTGCANAGDKFKFFKVGSEVNATTWEIKGLTNEEYLVYAWQDVDQDKAYSVGDWFDKSFLSGDGTFVNPANGHPVHFVMVQATE